MKEKQKTCITITRSYINSNELGDTNEYIFIPHNVDYIRVIGAGCDLYITATDATLNTLIAISSSNLISNPHDNILYVTQANVSPIPSHTESPTFRSSSPIINGTYNFKLVTLSNIQLSNLQYGRWFITLEFIELEKS